MRHEVPKKQDPGLLVRMGAIIKAHRLRLGVTQEELAWRADIHRSYLADIERGGRNVTLRSIANLARALEVSVKDLMQRPDEEPNAKPLVPGDILLVEDNPDDVALTLRAFAHAKFTNPVKVVTDGQAALDHLFGSGQDTPHLVPLPQLVLLDLNLPSVPGIEVLRQIKAARRTREVPVVVLTVSQHDDLILECSRLGAANYIIKPVGFENFSRITPALDMHWALVRKAPVGPKPDNPQVASPPL